MSGDGKNFIKSKGLRWHAHRMDELTPGRGVFVIFHTMEKNFEVGASEDLPSTLRASWWKKNFWNFTWFKIDSEEYGNSLKAKLEKLDYDAAWNFTGDGRPESK